MQNPDESVIPRVVQQAVIDALAVQVRTQAKVDSFSVNVDPKDPLRIKCDCLSVVGLNSDHLQGTLALGFPEETFLRTVHQLLGEKYEHISSENVDACAELLNIIFASARVKVNEAGFNFSPAIPSTVTGKNLSIGLGPTTKVLQIVFSSDLGPFLVALSLRRTKNVASSAA